MTFCRSSINRYTHIYVGIYINSTKLCVRIYYSIIDNIIIIRFGYVCFYCKCSVAKAFLEASITTKFDYFIGITTYVHMTSEHVVYRPTSTLDKLIIFDVPLYTGTTWTQLGAVPTTIPISLFDVLRRRPLRSHLFRPVLHRRICHHNRPHHHRCSAMRRTTHRHRHHHRHIQIRLTEY